MYKVSRARGACCVMWGFERVSHAQSTSHCHSSVLRWEVSEVEHWSGNDGVYCCTQKASLTSTSLCSSPSTAVKEEGWRIGDGGRG